MSSPESAGGGVPAWLAKLGVKSGGYFIDSKARAKRAMTSTGFSPVARIHICLGLATMGYQQELAVKMENGIRVPLTPADICSATGIRRENFRRHMAELEGYGLAECKGSTKGRVEIRAWAVPRTVDVKKIVIARGDDFSRCPPAIIPILKHYRIRPPDFVIAHDDIIELERLARMTSEAESSLRAYANGLRAHGRPNKEERNERNIERNEEAVGRQVAPAPPETGEPTDLPPLVLAEVLTINSIPGLDALIQVIEDVAVPVIGESPTLEQYIEIHQRLMGALPQHYRARLEAKKKQGKLESVMVLGFLADDCARNKDKWKPPLDVKDDKRSESIRKVAAMAKALRGGAS